MRKYRLLNQYRLTIFLIAAFGLIVAEGCGTKTYNERYEQRADELRYTE